MPQSFTTHDVLNQSPPFEDVNLFTSDRALVEAVSREGGGAAAKRLTAFGQACGSAAAFERGRLALRRPFERVGAVFPKGRHRRIFLICAQLRVFKTCFFVSQARRACPIPSST